MTNKFVIGKESDMEILGGKKFKVNNYTVETFKAVWPMDQDPKNYYWHIGLGMLVRFLTFYL